MIRLKVNFLGPKMTKTRLSELFEEYGKVNSVKILSGLGAEAPVIGLVFMALESAASDAIEALQGKEIDGQKINIEMSYEHIEVHHDPKRPRVVLPEDEDEDDTEVEETDTEAQAVSNFEEPEEPNWEV